jgi:hypothetical protein
MTDLVQRIATSIFVLEVCTIFVPCWQVRKHQNLRQETLESIANWESKKRFGSRKEETSTLDSSVPPMSPTSTKVGESRGFDSWKKLPGLESNSQSNLDRIPDESVLTMAALEHVLDKNPEPLRQFSARRDFSGENIAFLTAVAEWKTTLTQDFVRNRYDSNPDMVRQQFTRALRIYTEFISPRDAEFPINIAWHDLRKLQGIFERAARSTVPTASAVDAATPFAEVDWQPSSPAPPRPAARRSSRDSESLILGQPDHPGKPPTTAGSQASGHITICTPPATADSLPLTPTAPPPDYQGDIPQAFDAAVFDAAQASIKYLVLTNTWPKYVRERRGSESSSDSSSTSRSRSTAGASSRRSKKSLWGAFSFLGGSVH